ncbi:hypothetical protein NDU88_005351 [Pleurodeles waltl]|uniref:Uncharacterized protein n=1 Tax=Pleurodeles waltl TaxID=8319 RepID=A0AAV7PFQ0_PLEWA|nr:hypothetical protein NDU88_005351 [Pleurodeles waltl]
MSAGSPSVASDPTRRQSSLLRPPFVPVAPLCPAHLGRAAPPQALGVSSLGKSAEQTYSYSAGTERMDIWKLFVKKRPSEVTLYSDNSETNTINSTDMPHLQFAIEYGVRVADLKLSSDYAPVPGIFCEVLTSLDESSNSSSATATSLQDNEETLGSTVAPNQPHESTMAVQIIETQSQIKKKHFLGRGFQDLPWLHYSYRVAGLLCFNCAKARSLKLTELSKNEEEAFCSTGYNNWKKAIERFKKN